MRGFRKEISHLFFSNVCAVIRVTKKKLQENTPAFRKIIS